MIFVLDVIQGASAAVNAIILLEVFLFPTRLVYLYFVVPVPAMLVVSLSSLRTELYCSKIILLTSGHIWFISFQGALLIGSDLWRIKTVCEIAFLPSLLYIINFENLLTPPTIGFI